MSIARTIGQAALSAAWYAANPGALRQRRAKAPARPRAGYDAARMTRLTSSWTTTQTSIDAELWSDLPRLRDRSRDLYANNEYVKRFSSALRANVVGPDGITLQNRARLATSPERLDTRANDLIEAAWKQWSRPGRCDVTRQFARADLERLLVDSAARDGEVLVRIHPGFGNADGFALQVYEADHLDDDHNARQFDDTGNRIRMGVELDRYGAPVAYHIRTEHPGDYTYRSAKGTRYERVLASQMLHLFVAERPHQTRGLPWLHAAMIRLQDLGAYREAAVIAARVGAAKMGFYVRNPEIDAGDQEPRENGARLQEAEPGHFDELREGETLQTWDPTYPHEQFGDFNKATLRGIAGAMGMGVAYHNISGDLEGVNFSSARIGELAERDGWRVLQQWLIQRFHERVFEAWLRHMLTTGRLGGLSLTQYQRLHAPHFQGRSWPWVDPLKEGQAYKLLVDEGFMTRGDVVRQRGGDPDEVWRKAAAEREALAELGLTFGADRAPGPVAGPPALTDEPDDDDTEESTDEQLDDEQPAAAAPPRRSNAA